MERLPWSRHQQQMRERVSWLRKADASTWPDLSDEALAKSVQDWLAPYIEGRASLAAITAEDMGNALSALLPWPLPQKLDEDAPTHFTCPTGSNIPLDYAAENGPLLCVRVQELYGLKQHPSIANGRIPLTLQLLSPAHRPIQITKDLPGFWKGSWSAVKSEMKGRYPRHFWPDDPAGEQPTTRVKSRM